MATIDNLSIQVTANAESAASALDRLASSAGGLRGAAAKAGGGMRDLSAGAKDAGTATKEAGQQAGNAERHTRDYGRAAQEAGNAAKRGTAGIATFWEALKRVAYYRFVRTIIKAITASFKEGLTHLYQYSNAINGHFAKSLDNLATSTLYLKNSLGTLAAPLIEALAPALEWIIDKVVEVINFFNMFVAAISGKSSYTAAVKVATTATAEWGKATTKTTKTAKESIDELKRTILGFDEINKLDKDKIIGGSGGSGSGGGSGGTGPSPSSMFEERPLEGFFKDLSGITRGWPDWLKWLFGIGGIAIAGWGISLLPKLIGKIWDALKRLFGITIPDWFKWLFGPKDDGGGIDFPDKIDIPDAEVNVDLKKGDWSALDDIDDITIPVQLSDSASDLYKDFKNDWESTGSKALYFSPKLDNSAAVLYEKFKREWDASGSKVLYFSPKLDNTAKTLYEKFKREWDISGSKILYFSPKLDNAAKALYDNFKRTWDEAGSKILYLSPKLDNTGKVLWETLKREWDAARSTLYVSPKLDNTGTALWNILKREWEAARTALYASPILDNTGMALWNALKNEWDNARVALFASPKLDNKGSVLFNAFQREWNDANPVVFVGVALKKSGWDTVTNFIDGSFGGATGGGGKTSGGGAGRGRHGGGGGSYGVEIGLHEGWTGTPQEALGINNLKADATVSAVPGEGFTKAKGAIQSFKLKKLEDSDVRVNAVYNKQGGLLSSIFSKIGTWLFGKSNTPSTDVKVNSTAGKGFSSIDSSGKFKLVGIKDSEAYISAKTQWGEKHQSLAQWIGLNDLKGDAYVSVSTQWGNAGASLRRWIGLEDDLSATANIHVGLSTEWGIHGSYSWKDWIKFQDNVYTTLHVNISTEWWDHGCYSWEQWINYKSDIYTTHHVRTVQENAAGGVVTANGSWSFASGGVISNGIAKGYSNIPHYAGGTRDAHGTLFLAGEAGPEIVGHVGGRTEILNQSQLAQTMFAAVRSAMTGVRIGGYIENAVPDGGSEADYETMYRAMYDAFTDAMAGNAERDKEKLALMREIAAKDFNPEISTASINRAQMRINRRAGTTIVPVGT